MYFQLDDMLPFTVFFLLFVFNQRTAESRHNSVPTSDLLSVCRVKSERQRKTKGRACAELHRDVAINKPAQAARAAPSSSSPLIFRSGGLSPSLFFTIYDSILLTLRLLAAAGFRMGNTHLYSHRAVTKSRRQIGKKKEIFKKKPSLPRGFINNRLFAKTQRNWAAALATSRLIVEWEFINRLHLYMLLLLLHGKDVGGGGRSECQVFFSTGSID